MDRTTFEKFGHRPMGDGRVSIWRESSNAISSTAIVLGAEDLRKLLEEVEGVRIAPPPKEGWRRVQCANLSCGAILEYDLSKVHTTVVRPHPREETYWVECPRCRIRTGV